MSKALEYSEKYWNYIPDSILLKIFHYLNFSHYPALRLVSKQWCRVSQDELLWKSFFTNDFKTQKKKLSPGRLSWLLEYKRLIEEVPYVLTETLEEHNDQVLHASFSHCGKMFATTSKDSFVIVWDMQDYPARVVFRCDMKKAFSFRYTQFSQFNESDTLLLVSGVKFRDGNSGEIIVFDLREDFKMKCRVPNKPYDVFGAWFNNDYLLAGDLKWLGNFVSANIIWLNKSSQENDSEHTAIRSRFCQFYNENGSSVRNSLIAQCSKFQKLKGNPVSQSISSRNLIDNSCQTFYSNDCEVYQTPEKKFKEENCENEDFEEIEAEKLLIFTTGSRTYSPHQIGIKRIKNFRIKKTLDVDMDIRSRIVRQESERQRAAMHADLDVQYAGAKEKFDDIDYLFDLSGHIIGMALSPDHRYLYVNNRPWPENCVIEDPISPPVIAQEIDIHVIDLLHMKKVGSLLTSHRAYTPNNECFFIFLDVSDDLVASGAEDKNGYIWERYYETCLVTLPHKDVVNCVTFNPVDPQTLISVSDDHDIRIWRSRKKAREMGIKITKENVGAEKRVRHAQMLPLHFLYTTGASFSELLEMPEFRDDTQDVENLEL